MSAETSKLVLTTLLSIPSIQEAVRQDVNSVQKLLQEFKTLEEAHPATQNPLIVRQMENLFVDIFRALGTQPLDFLLELLNLASRIHPNEVAQIQKCLETLDLAHNQGKHKNILLKGEVQSGKTTMIILLMMCYLLGDVDVVVLVRISKDDKIQLENRIKKFLDDLEPFKRLVSSSRAKHYIHLQNTIDMTKCLNKLNNRDHPFVLLVDEADLRELDNKQANTAFKKLFDKAFKSIFVSATTQDLCVEKLNITRENIIWFEPPRGYRGLNHLHILERPEDTHPINLLDEIVRDEDYSRVRPEHPQIVLFNVESERVKIQELALQLSCYPREDIWVLSYTGTDGIVLFKDVEVQDVDFKDMGTQSEGRFRFKKGMGVSDVLLWMGREGGVDKFSKILMVANRTASRGINLSSYDSQEPKNSWHLTHQVLLRNNDSTQCSYATQALRILGVHNDDIPLKLYTTPALAEKIKKSNEINDQVLRVAMDKDHPLCPQEGRFLNEVYTKIPINRKVVPSKFIKKPSKVLKLVTEMENCIGAMEFVEDQKGEQQDRDFFDNIMVDTTKLKPEGLEVYNNIYQNIKTTQRWTKVLDFLRKIYSQEDSEAINNKLWNWRENYQTQSRQKAKGIVFKKEVNTWWIRYSGE